MTDWIDKANKNGHLFQVGEFGGEGQDAYETLAAYPPHWGKPPAKTAAKFWKPVQAYDKRMPSLNYRIAIGRQGRPATNLVEMIEGTQGYQAYLLSKHVVGYRVGTSVYTGYFHYHLLDVLPAHWPKSIVSHDFRPKLAYFELAQVNQPVAPLHIVDEAKEKTPRRLALLVDNDLDVPLTGCTLRWTITGKDYDRSGEKAIPATAPQHCSEVTTVPIDDIPEGCVTLQITLDVVDADGGLVARYQRSVWHKTMR
jgi:hypothetical protein